MRVVIIMGWKGLGRRKMSWMDLVSYIMGLEIPLGS